MGMIGEPIEVVEVEIAPELPEQPAEDRPDEAPAEAEPVPAEVAR
jgi:hypothetical protein